MAGKRKKRRHGAKVSELGLIPFMNLILILIPALLISASLTEVAVIDAAYPDVGGGCEENPGPDPGFEVSVRVTEQGFTVRSRNGSETSGTRDRQLEIALDPRGEYAFGLLRAHLRRLKNENPDARALTLSADDGIAYGTMVRVMDATREDAHSALFPDLAISMTP